MKRAAIYARVSTIDRGQDTETQLRRLREYAELLGFPIAFGFVDHASGAKNDRVQYRAMLHAARRREFDVLLVWRYDRFARSLRELVNALAEFDGLGIEFVSYNEGADTTELLEAVRAVLAASPFHGEGHRKVWARLRHGGVRTSRRRVLRLM